MENNTINTNYFLDNWIQDELHIIFNYENIIIYQIIEDDNYCF